MTGLPALTAEEWERNWSMDEENLKTPLTRAIGFAVVAPEYIDDPRKALHGLAALALYGQPFGFTREMVAALRTLLADHIKPDRGRDGDVWYSDELEQLIVLGRDATARIEALLPPEPAIARTPAG